MNIEIKTFKESNLLQINQFLKLVFKNKSKPYFIDADFLKERIIKSQLFRTDCSKILMLNNDIVAVAIANLSLNPLFLKKDFIHLNLLAISSLYERKKIEDKLINTLLNEVKNNNKKGIITSLQWGGIWAGVFSDWKEETAFCSRTNGILSEGELFLEIKDKVLKKINLPQVKQEILIRSIKKQEIPQLKKFINNNFGVGWLHEVLNKMSQNYEPFNGYGVSKPYCPDDVFVLEYKKQILGFCVAQSNTLQDIGFLGPIAIDKTLRKQKLGQLLLLKTCQYLVKKGKKTIGLWTNEIIYRKFYYPFGFRKTFETNHITWLIQNRKK